MRRLALTRRYVQGFVFAVAAAVVCSLLGRWQWDVAASPRGDLQNLAYAFNWWLFAVLFLGMWGKLLRDEARELAKPPADPEPLSGPVLAALPRVGASGALVRTTPRAIPRRLEVMSSSAVAPIERDDPEVVAWNDWLATLNAKGRR